MSAIKFAFALLLMIAGLDAAMAQTPSRLALVIGNAAYRGAPPLRTAIADAQAVTETMRAAGYAVTELTDVRADDIGNAIGTFLDQAEAAGPEAVVFVYFAGYALQAGGDNFLVPVDAEITGAEDIANQAFRLSDLTGELAEMQLAARIIVVDGAHEFPLPQNRALTNGLALVEPPPGSLIAFSAAPGALALEGDGENSVYATALVTLMRQPGLDIDQIFRGVRLQVNEDTGGAQTPWAQSTLEVEVVLFEGDAGQSQQAAPRVPPRAPRAMTRSELSTMPEAEAYHLVIEQDTLEGYQWFVELYPQSIYAADVWDLIALRREAILWRRTLAQDTARAYWNYLERYPDGAHADEARLRLEALSEPVAPPPNYFAAPEAIPPGYDDEALHLPEILPRGAPVPPPRFVVRPPRLIVRPPRDVRRPPRQWVRPPLRPIGAGRPGVRPVRLGIQIPPSRVRPARPSARPGQPPRSIGTPQPMQPVQPGRPIGQPAGPGMQRPGMQQPGRPTGQPPRQIQPERPTGRPMGQPPRQMQPGQPTGQPARPNVQQPGTQRPGMQQPGRPIGQPPRQIQPERPTGRPMGQPPRQMQPGQPTGQPARPNVQQPRPPAQTPRPAVQPPRSNLQQPRPQPQPQRPAMQPQQPQRPVQQPARPMGQPMGQPLRPVSQPQRPQAQPARPSGSSCPPGTRMAGGACVR